MIEARPAEERFEAKVDRSSSPDGCWLWTGCVTLGGYARFRWDGAAGYAHRWAYEYYVGPIPTGLQIDHVRERGCVNRHCVNPAHLEPVTPRENVMRSDSPFAKRAAQTHCLRGHLFTEESTYWRPGPITRRNCRICRAACSAARHRKM